MMSYSSSSSSTRESYDVFMSFRGEDTRTGFTSHLYDALTRKHIRTYKDDKSLEIGNFIAPELLEAIEASRFAIVVLSSNFATSRWCLEEIAKIVDCKELGKLIVIPVFYHVDPSDVRHQGNCFEQGFINHEANPEITPQKVKTWRAAFEKVGAIKGSHVTQQRNESEVVSEIVRKVLKGKHDVLTTPVNNGLVGIDSRVHEVRRMLSMEPSEIHFIGICGMSGMGKTTLAEVVFNGIQNNFQGSCFIENIKDVSKKNDSTSLCKLQKKLLDDILKDNIHVQSVSHGQTLLGTLLRGLKVLIVLDDVNHLDQLTYLAGSREWFGRGTRIIITTTNNYLLDSHILDEVYTCEELKGDEALRLFSQSAFKKGHPTHGYEKLSNDIVKLAGGLPLALKVYGSLLCGKLENYWKIMLKKLQEYPHEEVLGRLETVYARLDRDQKNTFVYIACFLRGRNIHLVKDILTNLHLYPECGIPDLINKFLITINHDDTVWVHDLLQQMCWEVLCKESERHDGKHIAIKYRQNLEDILSSEPEGTRTIEIINQEPYEVEGPDFFDDHNCFSKMMKLKFLRISKIDFQQGLDRLSSDLRILEWYGCSLKSFPTMFNPKYIFELELCYSLLETLWNKNLDLPNLRYMNLSFSKDLTKIPDLTSASNLVKLNLEGCTSLTELHESVLLQKRLRYMNLRGCTNLKNLGRNTMELEALEALLLSGCSNLEYLPEFGENMKSLEHLYVDGTSIKKLPDNMGEMRYLRNLDANGTSIEELPSCIHRLKKLRLLNVNRCRLSFKTGGFLYTNPDTILSCLRELDLSYCNLYVVPDGIGLLYSLITLDVSGNYIGSLPASIGLLSKLRMLRLNNCKMLKSLPKLSLVDEDADYGRRSRFHYYFSEKGLDASKFHATTSNNSTPTVSCLNCPKLVVDENGSYLAEKILNGYLQLRTNYWVTPEAVFEIVGAGNNIPLAFEQPGSNSFIIEGPWIGVAICAVVSVLRVDAYLEAKHMVTAHIHFGEKHWKIPVGVTFLVEGLESQLVFYWTVADDLQRLVDSVQRSQFGLSFSVEPGDGNLQVIKFGVRIIRNDDILQLRLHKHSTSLVVHSLFASTLSLPTTRGWYLHACPWVIHDLTRSINKFILDYGKQQNSLDGIHNIIKCLLEINQEVLSECREEMSHVDLLPLVFDYYQTSHGTSELYNDFVRLLKDITESWLSVKLALEQIVAKSRVDNYTYEEMLQQLNDLEAAKSVKFNDSFVISFAYISKQIVSFLRHLNEEIRCNQNLKSLKVLSKVSSVTIAGIFSMVATYVGDSELLQGIKDITSYSQLLSVIESFLLTNKFSGKCGTLWSSHKKQFVVNGYEKELGIWDFYENAILLQELKKKMARFHSLTKENEEEMMIVIDKLEKKVNNLSLTIEDMSSHASTYSTDIKEVGINLYQFLEDKFGVDLIHDENILELKQCDVLMTESAKRGGDSMSEAMSIFCQATLSVPSDMQWYINALEADSSLLSCNCSIHDHSSIIYISLFSFKRRSSINRIQTIIECVLKINREAFMVLNECKEEWKHTQLHPMVYEYYEISCATSQLYTDFVRLLKDICDRWLSVKAEVEGRPVDTFKETLKQLSDLEAKSRVRISGNFLKSLACICKKTTAFLRHFNEEIQELKSGKVLAKGSSGLISGVFSVLTNYMVDSELLKEMPNSGKFELLNKIQDGTLNSMWLHFIRNASWKSPSKSDCRLLWIEQVSDDTLVFSHQCTRKLYHQNSREMRSAINGLGKKIILLSKTIEDMSSVARKYNDDIRMEGITLEISQSDYNRSAVKRKR